LQLTHRSRVDRRPDHTPPYITAAIIREGHIQRRVNIPDPWERRRGHRMIRDGHRVFSWRSSALLPPEGRSAVYQVTLSAPTCEPKRPHFHSASYQTSVRSLHQCRYERYAVTFAYKSVRHGRLRLPKVAAQGCSVPEQSQEERPWCLPPETVRQRGQLANAEYSRVRWIVHSQ